MDKVDSQGMYKIYDKWPELARQAYESELEPVHFDGIDHIVFAGMGGSGAIADIFNSILSKTNIHVSIVKGYLLPNTVDSQTLVVATSASGDTSETLKALESSLKLDCKRIAFSSGGLLEEFCTEHKINYRKIPIFQNPRSSFPTYVYSIIRVLYSILPIEHNAIEESLENLEKISQKISSKNLSKTNPSLLLAEWLSEIPMILYPAGLQPVAVRFKNSIQENMKQHAMVEDVVEFCHNGIVAWEKKSNVKPILVRGTEDYIKTKERWNIVKDFFYENNIDYWEVISLPGNILTKIICMIYLLDYSTLYRAVIDGTDPHHVKPIDFIKERL